MGPEVNSFAYKGLADSVWPVCMRLIRIQTSSELSQPEQVKKKKTTNVCALTCPPPWSNFRESPCCQAVKHVVRHVRHWHLASYVQPYHVCSVICDSDGQQLPQVGSTVQRSGIEVAGFIKIACKLYLYISSSFIIINFGWSGWTED